SSVSHLWRDAQLALTGSDAELGKGAFALGATLLDSAAEASGPAQRRGFARSVEVLEDAIRYLEAAGDLEMARYANSLAAAACDHFKELYLTNSHERHDLERRASAFRARS